MTAMGSSGALSRRDVLLAATSSLASLAGRSAAHGEDPAPTAPRPMRCADFLASLGVNTHLRYGGRQYQDVSAVVAAMKYAGLRFARDAAILPGNASDARYEAMAEAGVSFCMFLGPKPPLDEVLPRIEAFAAAYPHGLDALEGPNEVKPTLPYGGETGVTAALQFMADLRAAKARYPKLRSTPVANFTASKSVASACDFGNVHLYPSQGAQPRASVERAMGRLTGPTGIMPEKPVIVSEMGYHTLVGKPARPGDWQGVDEDSQATLLVNSWLVGATLGVRRLYLYQLLDGEPDASLPNMQNHFGLFRLDGTPKPAAKAIRALTLRLADTARGASDFRLRPLAARIDIAPPLAVAALQNARGEDFLIFWNEAPIWDAGAAAPRDVAPRPARLRLPAPRVVTVWDAITGAPVASDGVTRGGTGALTVEIGAHPVVVRLT